MFRFHFSELFSAQLENFIKYYFFDVLTGKKLNRKIKVHPKSAVQDAKYAFGHESHDYDKL